ncbi:hypothetical protein TKK_0011216 [Trichogramma kaykai]
MSARGFTQSVTSTKSARSVSQVSEAISLFKQHWFDAQKAFSTSKPAETTSKAEVVLQITLLWGNGSALPIPIPAKKNDILAGTDFLSVFINGAMAPRPTRRRLSLRRGHSAMPDNVAAESKSDEANIFRISRAPITIKPTPPKPKTTSSRDDSIRYYPISHKVDLDNAHHSFETIVDDLGRPGDISTKIISKSRDNYPVARKQPSYNKTSNKLVKPVNQKIIGVSVTSSVDATPHRIKIEYRNPAETSSVSRPTAATKSSPSLTTIYSTSSQVSVSSAAPATTRTTEKTSSTSVTTARPANALVTEELDHIVSESNRSEFSVDEKGSQTSSHESNLVTPVPGPASKGKASSAEPGPESHEDSRDSATSHSEQIEHRYEYELSNGAETKPGGEASSDANRLPLLRSQGRKVGRHYEDSSYNQPSEIYNVRQNGKSYDPQHPKIYGEPSKVYSEPAKVYSEPAKVYGEPSKVYGEPSKVYSKPEKVYSEPARVYSEPAKVYSKPAKVYGEPAKVYDFNGQPVGGHEMGSGGEPEEKNYEVDEAVSVGSNGNIHGLQPFTEASNIEEDGHKVGYVVEGRNYRKYRVEERTADGFIVGEYGVVSHDDGSLRGVRYTADGTINPRLIYDALMKFLAL